MFVLSSSSFPSSSPPYWQILMHTLNIHTHTHTLSPEFHPRGRRAKPCQVRPILSRDKMTKKHPCWLLMSGSTRKKKKRLPGVPQGSVLGPIPFLVGCRSVALTSRWSAPPFLLRRLRWQSWCSPRSQGAWKLTCKGKACGTRRGTTRTVPCSRQTRRSEDTPRPLCRPEETKTRRFIQASNKMSQLQRQKNIYLISLYFNFPKCKVHNPPCFRII